MLRVLLPLAAAVCLLALGAFRLGPEQTLPSSGSSLAVGEQRAVSVVFGGGQYLAVWQDRREGRDFDIYGARVGPDGALKEPAGIRLSAEPGDDVKPRAAFDGTHFFVVWEHRGEAGADVWGVRVSSEGERLDPAPIPISSAPHDQGTPDVAFDGQYLVTWADCRNQGAACLDGAFENADVYGAWVSLDGTVQEPQGFPIATAVHAQSSPSVAAGGGQFLVVWKDFRSGVDFDLFAARVSSTGGVVDPQGFVVVQAPSVQHHPQVAHNGTDFVVAWEDRRSGASNIYAARVSASAQVREPSGLAVHSQSAAQFELALTCRPGECALAWHDHRAAGTSLVGARFSSQGQVLDPVPLLLTAGGEDPSRPSLSSDGQGYLLAYEDRVWAEGYDLSRVVLDGQLDLLGPPRPLSAAAPPQQQPTVLRSDGGYFLVWEERRASSHFDVRAAHLLDDGRFSPPGPLAVAESAEPERSPAVAFDGQRALVVWAEGIEGRRDLRGAWLDSALSPSPLDLSQGSADEWAPSVAYAPPFYLVVWSDRRGLSSDIYAARLSPEGQLMDEAGLQLSSGGFDELGPQVRAAGEGFLVGWEEELAPLTTQLRAVRVKLDGGVSPIAAPGVSNPATWLVAANQERTLWVWSSPDGGTQGQWGDSVGNASGTRVDGLSSLWPLRLSVAEGAFGLLGVERSDAGAALRWVQLGPDAGVFSTSPPLAEGAVHGASIDGDEQGLFLLAYERFEPAKDRLNPRVSWRFVATQDAGLPYPIEAPADAGAMGDDGGPGDETGGSADGGEGPPGSSGCGCSTQPLGWLAWWVLLGGLWNLRGQKLSLRPATGMLHGQEDIAHDLVSGGYHQEPQQMEGSRSVRHR